MKVYKYCLLLSPLIYVSDRDVDYMAFGLSGEDSRIAMIEADIVVVDYKEDRDPRAIDYYISDYAQVCYYKFVFE